MTLAARRLITGHNGAGKSCVMDESRLTSDESGSVTVCMRQSDGSLLLESSHFYPPPGATTVKLVRLSPPDRALSPADLDARAKAFFKMAGEECRTDTSRDPFMHVTPTVDFIVVLTGQVSLVLDEGEPVALKPFDVVVQLGTNHSWQVIGNTEVTLACVMIGHAGIPSPSTKLD